MHAVASVSIVGDTRHIKSLNRQKTTVSGVAALGFVQALEQPGNGKVLVVDGGASMRCALLGDNVAEMAAKNGWSVSPAPPAAPSALHLPPVAMQRHYIADA